MKNVLLLFLVLFSFPILLYSQGGENAAAASPAITLPFNSNGTTIGKNNDYNFPTGFNNWSTSGPDWLYYFCAPSTGPVQILLTNMTSIPVVTGSVYASITVWSGVPGAGGTLVNGNEQYLSSGNASTVPTQDVLLFNAVSSSCYYVMIDNMYIPSDTSTRNGFNYNITIQVPPVNVLQPSCTNIDFESGSLSGWSGTYGHTVEKGPAGASTPTYYPAYYGVNATDFSVTSGAATDPWGGFPTVCPGFGANSVRIGDVNNQAPLYSYPDRGGATLEQKFSVTASNALFTYKYAVVVEDAGTDHPNEEQPFFKAEVLDCNGVPIICGAYLVTGGPGVPGFTKVGTTNVYYKSWAPVFVDLSAYIGTCVTVKFSTADCSRGGHFCYAYVDAICAPMVITGPTYVCPGSTATLTSPIGGISYDWSIVGAPAIIGNAQSISVSPVLATTTYQCLITSATGCSATLTFDVLLYPTVVASATLTTICQGASGTVTATGFPAGGTYSWPGSVTTPGLTLSPSITTSYICTYTGPNNCTDTAIGIINVNPLPLPPITSPVAYCQNELTTALVVNPTSGNTLIWYGTDPVSGTPSTIAPIPNSSVVGAVTYYVSQVSAFGCESPKVPLVVTVNALPIITVNSPTICPSTSTTLTASGATTYVWDSNVLLNTNTYSVSPSTLTTYLVEGTLNGCKGNAVATVTVLNVLAVSVNSPTICEGQSVDLIQTGGVTCVWNTLTQNGVSTNSTYTVSPTVTTTYIVIGTSNGCIGTDTSIVTVNPVPTTIATSNSPICEGSTLDLMATSSAVTGSAYSWSGPGIIGVSTLQNPILNVAATSYSGSYSVTVSANGCSSTSNVDVVVNPIPLTVASVNSPVCEGTSLNFTATNSSVPGAVYSWSGSGFSPNSNLQNPTIPSSAISMSGAYILTITANNCSSTKIINVVVNPIPVSAATSNSPVCSGDDLNLFASSTGVANTVYEWSGPAFLSSNYSQNPVINSAVVLNSGLYSVKVSVNGCFSTSNVNVIVNETPTIVASVQPVCLGETLNFTSITTSSDSGYLFSWTGPVSLLPIQNPSISNASSNASGLYTVTVLSNGCSASSSVNAVVNLPIKPLLPPVANPICEASISPVLPTASLDVPMITGTWTPNVVDNLNSGTYVFKPDPNQCALNDTLIVVVIPLPILPLPIVGRICEPGVIDLTNQSVTVGSSGGVLSYWTNVGCTIPLSNPTSVGIGGAYYIKSSTTTTPSCFALTPVVVQIDPRPIANFTASPSVLSSLDTYSQMINNSSGSVSYFWNFGDEKTSLLNNPDHYFPDSELGEYTINLIAFSEFGCIDTAVARVIVNEELIFYVPNTFTPDNDDFNEMFQPVFTSGYDPYDYTLLIFNRWGQIVFESHDAAVGWKGTYGVDGDLVQDDTYTWKIDFALKQNKGMKSIVGHVNVLK